MKHFSISALGGLFIAGAASAQMFSPGQLVIVRSGNGTIHDSTGQGGVSLFASNKLVNGQTLAFTFPLNNGTAHTAAPNSFTTSSGSEDGKLSRSPNGQFLAIGGYATSQAATGITTGTVQRRIAVTNFTANLTNNPTFSFSNMTPNMSGAINCACVDNSGGIYYGGTSTGVVYLAPGSSTPVVIGQSGTSIFNLTIAGGALFAITSTTLVRYNGTPTTTGNTPVSLITTGSPQSIDFIDGQTAILGGFSAATGLRRAVLGTGNWATATASPSITFTNLDTTNTAGYVATDGHRVYANNWATSPVFRGYSNLGGITAPVTLAAAASTAGWKGVQLAPEPSIIASAPTGTAGVQRIAMRHQGTATDPFVRSVRIANVDFASGRVGTTIATIPYRGSIQDMAVDNAGNTLLLNVIPNATFTDYVYSIIRVSSDGTANDEGPLSTGTPAQAAPAGFTPTAIAADPTTGQAAVLLASRTNNTCQIGLVSLPGSIGGGVSTISNWGAFTATSATQRAVELSYTSTGQIKVLFSDFSAGNGNYEILNINSATAGDSSSFGSSTAISGLRAYGIAMDNSGNARVLHTGRDNGRPNQFRVDVMQSGGTVAAGNLFTRDSSATNSSTGGAIFGQVIPVGISYDSASLNPVLTLAGTSGSFDTTVLAGDQRIGIPGSFRAWRLNNSTNNPDASTYRFMPGHNLN